MGDEKNKKKIDEMIEKALEEIEKSEQKAVNISDPESRFMENKKKRNELSYNPQITVDHDSGIIVANDVTQDCTDHNQLQPQIKDTEENERLAIKAIEFSKKDYWLNKQMIFYISFFNFVRPHSGLKLKIDQDNNDITNKKYIQRTPMMAVGKTDYIWSLEELLTFPFYKTSVN